MVKHVIVVGAGVAGLAAALHLEAYGAAVTLLEADDRPGGRLRSDEAEGFVLDRGFQVLLTAYPEAQQMLDYYALNLGRFKPGATVLYNQNDVFRLGDPLRNPAMLLPTVFAPVGSLRDKLRILALRNRLIRKDISEIFETPESTTREYLLRSGFSERVLQRFFTPFFQGIFLESSLSTSSRMFEFVYKMFSEGYAALPAGGIGQIPLQLAAKLRNAKLLTNQRVVRIEGPRVSTADGQIFEGDAVLLAVDPHSELGRSYFPQHAVGAGTTCLYFSSDTPPGISPAALTINAAEGWVNTLCLPHTVAKGIAPTGKHLISVSGTGVAPEDDERLAHKVRQELAPWMNTSAWRLLRVYRIPYALPLQMQVRESAPNGDFKLAEGLYACGDHLLHGSLHAALKSGRLAAAAIREDWV